jgi:hypothetical protein
MHAYAFAENDAAQAVQTYRKSVACQIGVSLKPVKVKGARGSAKQGDRYVVYWEGDIGCGRYATCFIRFITFEDVNAGDYYAT